MYGCLAVPGRPHLEARVAAATEAPELVQTGSVSADAGVPPVPGILVRADPTYPYMKLLFRTVLLYLYQRNVYILYSTVHFISVQLNKFALKILALCLEF